MTERHESHGSASAPAEVDRELDLKNILLFGVFLAVLLVAAGAAILLFSDILRDRLEATDPPPAVLPEARRQEPPPQPRLQADPADDMRMLRGEEERLLGSYGWVDEAGGIARIPIDRALEIVARDGLRSPAPPAPGSSDGDAEDQ